MRAYAARPVSVEMMMDALELTGRLTIKVFVKQLGSDRGREVTLAVLHCQRREAEGMAHQWLRENPQLKLTTTEYNSPLSLEWQAYAERIGI